MGALRTGSTYLASLLDQHPSICVADPKEPGFFTGREKNGLEWYRRCFQAPEESVLIDATAWYSSGPTSRFPDLRKQNDTAFVRIPARIHELCPQAVFIYIVRDPIERVDSLYWFLRRSGEERRALARAIREDPLYVRSSDYRGQLSEFLKFFPSERFLVLSFDELTRDPGRVADSCFRFLGLDTIRVSTEASRSQRNASDQFRALPRLAASIAGSPGAVERAFRGLVKITPTAFHNALGKLVYKSHPPLGDADRNYLKRRLVPEEVSKEPLAVKGGEHVRRIEESLTERG